MVNYEYPPLGGGGGIAHQEVSEALARAHEVHVLTTHFPGLPRSERRNGVTITRVPVWGRTSLPTATIRSMVTFAPSAFLAGLSLVRAWHPHIINTYFAVPSGLPAVLLGRLMRIPVVLTLIGSDIFDPNPTAGISTHRHPLLRAIIRRIIRAASARVAISDDTKRRAQDYHGAPPDIEVIPLGLVPPRNIPSRSARAPDDRVFRIVTIGRLIPRKGYRDLLEAIALANRSDIHLHLIGDGPLGPELRAAAERLGLTDRVTFHGAVNESEKWNMLFDADCFISASLYEGFGIVFLEAMYAGLPIIATDEGGQTDFLVTGENALLVPPRQPHQLAAALSLLLREETLRRRLGEANRMKAGEHLITRTARRYEELFERVLSTESARTARGGVPVRQAVTQEAKLK